MTTPITTGIDQVTARPAAGGGWLVRFRSEHAGLCHQAYVNGRLAAWTERPDDRRIVLAPSPDPLAVTIAAVEPARRAEDLSDLLPPESAAMSAGWLHRVRIVRGIAAPRGTRVQVLSDRATGRLDERPLAEAELWPARLGHWGFGEYAFGLGGLGHGGLGAPGLGMGAFGAASFGMDADVLGLIVVLAEPGVHQVVVRTIGPDGLVADGPAQPALSAPPPAPPSALTVAAYDPEHHVVTLRVRQ